MEIAMSPTREQFPLSSKKPIKKTMSSVVFSAIIVGTLLVTLLVFISLTPPIGKELSLLLGAIGILSILLISFCLINYLYQIWYYQVYYYELTDDFVTIRKGVFSPTEITIPYARIQDVNVDQDILDRCYGLYDVHLTSATVSSAMEAHIDGVEKQAADGLRDKILQKIQEKINKSKS